MKMIISQETIKPSFPTPPHLKTYNLSAIDNVVSNIYTPLVFFYQNHNNGDKEILKKSLAQCLTQYYPFAGRFSNGGSIDCNDQGVNFLEAFHDSRLDDFILKKEQDDKIYELSPNGLGCMVGKTSSNLVEVQLNHFTGGGSALGVSISHKVADGFTMVNFITQWANIARGLPTLHPNFFSSSSTSDNTNEPNDESKDESKDEPKDEPNIIDKVKFVTRVFVFPNSKLIELQKEVKTMGMAPTNPSRVEVLTSLIFKCAIHAAADTSGYLKPSNLLHTVNMRNQIIKNDPEKAAGNICTMVVTKSTNPREVRLDEMVANLRKAKNELKGLKDVQEVGEDFLKTLLRCGPGEELYVSSSMCRFPFYEVDFGWGKPVEVTITGPNSHKSFNMIDTPQSDGIVAIVNLPEEEMLIFEQDKELLAYVS